jgi:hypothetical protein
LPDAADSTAQVKDADDSAALWRTSATQVRDTIKYIVAGFAAVGTILVGTAPLAGIGKVHGGWWLPALIGAVLALGGVIFAVWKASDVLLPSVSTLDEVKSASTDSEMARIRDEVLGGNEGLFRRWGGTVDAFRAQRELEYATLAEIDSYSPQQGEQAALDQARKDVIARIEQLNGAANVALAGAEYATARDLARDRRAAIAVAAASVAVGVGLFTWAVNRPDSTSTEVEPAVAQPAMVTLTAAGRETFASLLGPSCAGPVQSLVLSGGSDGPWDVVTTGDGGCRPAHLNLASDQGSPIYVQVTEVEVTLTDAGKERLAAVLGEDCADSTFAALDLDSGGSDSHQLVTLEENGCKAVRFTLEPEDGTISS